MSESSTDDSGDSKTKSSPTEVLDEDIKELIAKLNEVADHAADTIESPWKHWSFLYKLMFIIGVVLILVLSCLLPILVLQQVNSNGKQDNSIHSLILETTQDDATIVKNQEKIIADNVYREQILINVCHATPGCVVPPKPTTP